MGRRDALEQGRDDVRKTIDAWQHEETRPLEPEAKRKTKRRPHEVERAARLVAITFPTPAWRNYIADKAAELGDMRPSDLLVYCLSYAFAALESGDLPPPDPSAVQSHHRAGEALDLFWEPPNDV